jgi:hypothetical protein
MLLRIPSVAADSAVALWQTIFTAAWMVIRPWLHVSTQERITFVKTADLPKYIPHEVASLPWLAVASARALCGESLPALRKHECLSPAAGDSGILGGSR